MSMTGRCTPSVHAQVAGLTVHQLGWQPFTSWAPRSSTRHRPQQVHGPTSDRRYSSLAASSNQKFVGPKPIPGSRPSRQLARPSCLQLLRSFPPLSIHLMNPWMALQFSIYSQQKAPLLPGIYFASVTCIGVHLWEKSARATIIGTFAMVVVAWAAAWDTAVAVHDMLSKSESSAELKTISAQVVAGSAAGFVGSAITAFGVSVASPNFRKPVTWIRTILIGTVAGSLLDDRLFGMRLHFLKIRAFCFSCGSLLLPRQLPMGWSDQSGPGSHDHIRPRQETY